MGGGGGGGGGGLVPAQHKPTKVSGITMDSRGLQLEEKLQQTSVFTNVQFLRQYDDHVLDCTDRTFSFHMMQCISKYAFRWTAVSAGTSRSCLRFSASSEVERKAMLEFFALGESRLLRYIKFPFMIDIALEQTQKEAKGCGLEVALDAQNNARIEDIHLRDHGRVDVYMDGETRIAALGALLSYVPVSAFRSLEQLPSLLIAMLCHCPRTVVDRYLPFWSRSVTSTHAVSGIWYGIPGRASSSHLSTDKIQQVAHRTLLLGLFIFLRERLFEFQVPPKFTDGLLYTCFDALLRHNKGSVNLRLQGVKLKYYDDVVQRQEQAHAKVNELVLYLRSVLSHEQAPTLELRKALRIAAVHERLTQDKDGANFAEVPSSQRRWNYKVCQPLQLKEVRRLLLAHDCVTQSKELDELDNRDTRLYFRIEDTTGMSVVSALCSTTLEHVFCVELADDAKRFVIVGLYPEDFYGHARWGMYWTVKNMLWEQQNVCMHIPKWTAYGFAPSLCQLWFSKRVEHWNMAIAILRDWAGLASVGTHVNKAEALHVRQHVIPTLLERYDALQVLQLLPTVLAFDLQHDGLCRLERKDAPVFPTTTHQDKYQMRLWYQLMDHIQAAASTDLDSIVQTVLTCFQFSCSSAMHRSYSFVSLKKAKDATNPYESSQLLTQFKRAKTSRLTLAECKHDDEKAQKAWQVFALMEQQSKAQEPELIYPLPPLGGSSEQHHCIHMFDWPVGTALSEYGFTELYCDSYFAVKEIDRIQKFPQLDVSDQFYFIRSAFTNNIGVSDAVNLPADTVDLRFVSPAASYAPIDAESQSKKRKSPPAPEYSPESDTEEEEEEGPFYKHYSRKDKSSNKRFRGSGATFKLTEVNSVSRTMELDYNFGSSADL